MFLIFLTIMSLPLWLYRFFAFAWLLLTIMFCLQASLSSKWNRDLMLGALVPCALLKGSSDNFRHSFGALVPLHRIFYQLLCRFEFALLWHHSTDQSNCGFTDHCIFGFTIICTILSTERRDIKATICTPPVDSKSASHNGCDFPQGDYYRQSSTPPLLQMHLVFGHQQGIVSMRAARGPVLREVFERTYGVFVIGIECFEQPSAPERLWPKDGIG